ncbi:hypothetical protein [Portibacter marinus]|uniref:hypothetical protein n=1 Tax=Portibacter marinus TaxID=2898660 RepID=UPI001F38F30D|nr:hypothetical protein [Portibacter marinus]
MKKLILFLVIAGSIACSKKKFHCIQFYSRECDTDPWAENYQKGDTEDEKIAKMGFFLRNINIDFEELTFEDSGGGCRGCHTCVGNHLIQMKLDEENLERLLNLDLLELSYYNCD